MEQPSTTNAANANEAIFVQGGVVGKDSMEYVMNSLPKQPKPNNDEYVVFSDDTEESEVEELVHRAPSKVSTNAAKTSNKKVIEAELDNMFLEPNDRLGISYDTNWQGGTQPETNVLVQRPHSSSGRIRVDKLAVESKDIIADHKTFSAKMILPPVPIPFASQTTQDSKEGQIPEPNSPAVADSLDNDDSTQSCFSTSVEQSEGASDSISTSGEKGEPKDANPFMRTTRSKTKKTVSTANLSHG